MTYSVPYDYLDGCGWGYIYGDGGGWGDRFGYGYGWRCGFAGGNGDGAYPQALITRKI